MATRAGGRIWKEDILFCSRHPVGLSSDHGLTALIIKAATSDWNTKKWTTSKMSCDNSIGSYVVVLQSKKVPHQFYCCRRRRANPAAPCYVNSTDRLQIAPVFFTVSDEFIGPLNVNLHQVLTDEVLPTTIAKVQWLVNSRTLTFGIVAWSPARNRLNLLLMSRLERWY